MDCRDDLTWIALELSRAGEIKVEEGSLESSLRRRLDLDSVFPIFIPSITYKKNGRNVTLHLMEGYAFVGSGLPDITYFSLEKKTNYVKQVLSNMSLNGIRVLSVIPNSYIIELKKQMRNLISMDISLRDRVKIVGGLYSSLFGEVIEVQEETAIVKITMRSLSIITQLPKMFLELIS